MARFKVGDKVTADGQNAGGFHFVVEVSQYDTVANREHTNRNIYRLRNEWGTDWTGWLDEVAIHPATPPKHRVVVEIEDPSALEALTGATIVSDTVI